MIHHAKRNGFEEYCLHGCKQHSVSHFWALQAGWGDRRRKAKESKAPAKKGKLLSAEKEEMTAWEAPGATRGLK